MCNIVLLAFLSLVKHMSQSILEVSMFYISFDSNNMRRQRE